MRTSDAVLNISGGQFDDRENAVQTYERYAHLGGVGPSVNLIAARDAGRLQPGSRTVMYAQGAGFTRAAASLSW